MQVMRRRHIGSGFFGLVLLALPLAGCSTAGFGVPGTFGPGPSPTASAGIPNSGNPVAMQALADARGHFRNNDFGDSAALYEKVVELTPKDPEGYVGLAASYDRLGRFDLADRAYGTLFKLTGGTAQYYNNLGYSYLLRGNLTAAAANFRSAQQLEPQNTVIANNLQILANAANGAKA
jgi:Flp pilus assembly protein TadD